MLNGVKAAFHIEWKIDLSYKNKVYISFFFLNPSTNAAYVSDSAWTQQRV